MSTDQTYQARVLANFAIPRIQREALQRAEDILRLALESQPPAVCAELGDAVRALLAQDHLTVAQRASLTEALATRLGALLEPPAARVALFAVGEEA